MSVDSATEPAACGPVELIACETCGSAERDAQGGQGPTPGERLLAELHASLAAAGAATHELRVSSVRCLWACKRSCAVHLRGPGRVGYVLCELAPDATSAEALIAYARLYARSADGRVPLSERPQALRGHFLCRVPATPL